MEKQDALELSERLSKQLALLVVELHDIRVAMDAHERSIDSCRQWAYMLTDQITLDRINEALKLG